MARRVLQLAVLIAALAAPGAAPAQLTFYGDRLAFDSDNPGLPLEDFEEGVPDQNFDSPLDSTSNNAVFSAGDILPGLTIQTDVPGSFDLRVRQQATTRILSTPSTLRTLELLFAPAVPAVAFDVFQLDAPGDASIEVFGAGGSLGSTAVATGPEGAFFGVVSGGEAITRIVVDDSAIVPAVDDVAFGVPEAPVLTFYGARLAFDSDNPGLPTETFEEGVPDQNFDSPLDSTSDNAVFSPGDILPGLTIQTDLPGNFDLRVRQEASTRTLSTPSTLRTLELAFSPVAGAVGFDVFQLSDPGDVLIDVFGPAGLLGSTRLPSGPAGAFFGVTTQGPGIARIVIDDTDILPAVDDVSFAPEPSAALSGGAALVALAMLLRLRRRTIRPRAAGEGAPSPS